MHHISDAKLAAVLSPRQCQRPKASAQTDGTSAASGNGLDSSDRSWAAMALALFVLCLKPLLVARCTCLAGSGAMIILE